MQPKLVLEHQHHYNSAITTRHNKVQHILVFIPPADHRPASHDLCRIVSTDPDSTTHPSTVNRRRRSSSRTMDPRCEELSNVSYANFGLSLYVNPCTSHLVLAQRHVSADTPNAGSFSSAYSSPISLNTFASSASVAVTDCLPTLSSSARRAAHVPLPTYSYYRNLESTSHVVEMLSLSRAWRACWASRRSVYNGVVLPSCKVPSLVLAVAKV